MQKLTFVLFGCVALLLAGTAVAADPDAPMTVETKIGPIPQIQTWSYPDYNFCAYREFAGCPYTGDVYYDEVGNRDKCRYLNATPPDSDPSKALIPDCTKRPQVIWDDLVCPVGFPNYCVASGADRCYIPSIACS